MVLARTREDAIVELDQVGNAENCPITPMRTFQIQFALTDRGDLSLEGFGEGTKEEIVSFAYPLLDKALADAYEDETAESDEGLAPNRRAAIARAVEREHDRIALEEAAIADPRTELGRDIKSRTDMPTVLVDRLVRQGTTKTLKNFKGRGKPS